MHKPYFLILVSLSKDDQPLFNLILFYFIRGLHEVGDFNARFIEIKLKKWNEK